MTDIHEMGIFTPATRPTIAWEVLWLYLASLVAEEQPKSDRLKGKAPEAASRPLFDFLRETRIPNRRNTTWSAASQYSASQDMHPSCDRSLVSKARSSGIPFAADPSVITIQKLGDGEAMVLGHRQGGGGRSSADQSILDYFSCPSWPCLPIVH
ncbi:uncharacterized protein CLUP02_02258 [Colletotrichum lupini]|uniref:Uncharacterized protein n=1 Tax=Colletotrichum lupini TaxID=145971 RepID=A0A9Q8SFL7_9PEZI|nr:uncharacterized protein CLUP02_02258 [Colletotrichum lupini]UQC75602.1 hypothetical protein CLUP02_02258 [Colletotrichum lupini]